MITIEGYMLNGFKLTLALPCNTVEEGLMHVRAAIQAGITPEPQDPNANQTETIVTVVRREHEDRNGRITPVVDFYPAWQGDYGQFRFCGVYLNTPEDIAQFESQSGLKLMNMPLYEAQGPLQRKPGSPKRIEIASKPFIAHKIAGEEKMGDDGKMMRPWKFAGYGSMATTIHAPVDSNTPSNPNEPNWWLALKVYLKQEYGENIAMIESRLASARNVLKQGVVNISSPLEDVLQAMKEEIPF